ncbi:MAG: hypothetical protein PVG78_16520 [Desulfobacterales bacterium]|jgi:hypothetical protein
MLNHLDNIPYLVLVPVAVLLLLAPLVPEPHVIEKLRMLKSGDLKRPIDIFDLCFHLLPTLLLCVKGIRDILR